MIKHLRKRITLLYAFTTGVIMTAVILGVILFSLNNSEKQQLDTFRNRWINVSSRLQFDQTISHSWLAVTEAENNQIIYIEENGIPFLYHGSWLPKTNRETLIERAKIRAAEDGVNVAQAPVSSFANQSSVFQINGDHGDEYYGAALSLATGKGVKSAVLISYITPDLQLIKGQIIYLLLLNLLGVAGLMAVSWHFAGWSLKPAEESRKRQSEFVAAASHELRSPLAVIRSGVSAITAAPEKTEIMIKNIDRECERMSLLISDMLLLASTDAKTWSLSMDTVNLETLLIETYELFQPLCTEKGLHLELRLPDEILPQIESDPQRLKQVLTVLLDNAVSYTPAGKNIYLEANVMFHKRLFLIAVRDQGTGIPDNQKPHIFDRFYRGDDSRNDKKHFGLGLSIAWELTAMLGGTITVADNAPEGTCFKIIFRF